MLTFRPSAQPNACRPFWKAAMRGGRVGSVFDMAVSTPMRRIRSPCARAASGHAVAAPVKTVIKLRRFIRLARRRGRARSVVKRDKPAVFHLDFALPLVGSHASLAGNVLVAKQMLA